jgi:hypothetical protein
MTAIYCPPSGCGGSSISVASQYSTGSALTGMYTTLSQNGNVVATGFTPASFPTVNGQTYTVTVSDYTNAYFFDWSTGSSIRSVTVTATGSTTSLTADYTTTPQTPPTSNSITVTSHDMHTGATLSGFFVDLRVNGNHIASGFTPYTFTNLQLGVQYQVVVYWYGSDYFRHFSDGNLNRYALVTLNSTAGQTSYSLDALYESVPKAQAASLNVIAQYPNGTQIGTTFNNQGYPQHTPGMWLTITPLGSTSPFTGTFTGGSILPFILFKGQTYTVSMTQSYNDIVFSHWQDTGSTNPVRTVALNGNTTVIAIYN